MLSVLCNANLNVQDSFSANNVHYSNLVENVYVPNLLSNGLFSEFVQRAINESDLNTLRSFLDKKIKSNELTANELVSLAISSLQSFVHINWLGPNTTNLPSIPDHLLEDQKSKNQADFKVYSLVDFFPLNSQEFENFQDKIRAHMMMDGESVFPVVKSIHLLLLAKLVFLDLDELFQDIPLFAWWSLRTIFLYQQLFEERSSTLVTKANELLSKLNPLFDSENEASLAKQYESSVYRFASICYYLEAGHIYYQIYNWHKGQECFKRALTLSNINFELVGVYGKRTKFQQKDLAQLLLKVNKSGEERTEENDAAVNSTSFDASEFEARYSNRDVDIKSLPQDVALNDETLLNKFKISNPEDEKSLVNNTKSLSQLEQAVLFCSLFDIQKNSPIHDLTNEEMQPFMNFILTSPKNWCIQAATLFMRTKLEFSSVKRMERSLLQLETLVDHYKQPNDRPETKYRYQFFYSVGYPSFWNMQKEVCKFYMQLGLINSSLELYINMKMWDDVIRCYQALDKKEKAEQIIRQQLEIKETPDLYCSLGEVTRELDYFHKAIELSKGKSARAYRMLAKLHFSKEQYEQAIEYFQKSLACNSMQYDASFMLGSAAFRSEKWEIAIKAFRTCTYLDPENHETWNNLAASYLKLNQKDKAHSVFTEALKVDYENWKIWENFLWTSTDCGYFEDVIKAYHRLLDLKEKYVDLDVLKALSTSVENNLNDANNVSILKYRQKVLKLFGRITSAVAPNWQIYWYYAQVVLHSSQVDDNLNKIELNKESAEKYFGLLFKSFRSLYNKPNWELAVDSCREIITHSTNVLTKCIEYGKLLGEANEFASLNLNIRSVISKLKQKYEVDKNESSESCVKLLYLKEVNDEFVALQQEYKSFIQVFFP